MRDQGPEELRRRTAVEGSLQRFLASQGYQIIDTPLLEPTELFLRKSGGELASRMYTFTDPGGNRVSLRPEFTSSAIRYYLEMEAEEKLPLRLQYCGPVFRYGGGKDSMQFHQLGAELIGDGTPQADGEVLALAWEGISALGVPSSQCVVGHIGVLHRILDGLGLSHRAQGFLVASLPRLRQGPQEIQRLREQAEALGLIQPSDSVIHAHLPVEEMEEGKALELLQDLFQDSLAGPMGSRSAEEILMRFVHKLQRADDPRRIDMGMSLLSRLASIRGEESQVLPQMRSLVQEHGLEPAVIQPLEQVLASFRQRCPSVNLTVDPGLVRGIAYYTGMVFEITTSAVEGGDILCGGGRYDGLIRALGGSNDVPALGFAFTMETLLESLPENPEESHLTSSHSQRR
ncbi:MAG: histidine--tRNA ligase family protein [Chloroflexi bacterium]|nr:histidine--tRNA ligase family protein [Chloroflexota bacterium]